MTRMSVARLVVRCCGCCLSQRRGRADGREPRVRRRRRRYRSGVRGPDAVAHVFGRLHGPAAQPTEADHAAERAEASPQWTFQSGTYARGRGFETTPLALDGVLYVTGANGYAWAIDARTGRPFWEYRRTLPADLTYGASAPGEPRLRHPRRTAVHGDARRALAGARSAFRCRALGRRARRLSHRLRRDAGAARRRRQSHCRHLRRRVPDARLRRCLRSSHGRAHLAAVHGPRTRRARQRDLADAKSPPRAAAAERG